MEYKVIIRQALIINASDRKAARRLAEENPPHVYAAGGDISGSYNVQSMPKIQVVSVYKAGRVKRNG